MELTVGIWTIKDLANWFGIKPNTLSHTKQKRFQELEEYANFEILKSGKVQIKEVKKPFYTKKKSLVYSYYQTEVPKVWRYNEIDTCSRVSEEIFTEKNNITESTGYKYTRQVRDELWGKPSKSNPRCYYRLAKLKRDPRDKKYDTYIPLGPGEIEIFNEEYVKFFTTTPEDQLIIQNKVKNKELTPEEAYEKLFPDKVYKSFLEHISSMFECDWIVNGTFVQKDFDEGNKED